MASLIRADVQPIFLFPDDYGQVDSLIDPKFIRKADFTSTKVEFEDEVNTLNRFETAVVLITADLYNFA